MRRTVALLLILASSACAERYVSMARYVVDGECWVSDLPEDVDLSLCPRKGDRYRYQMMMLTVDPRGDCWRMGWCPGMNSWEGWQAPPVGHCTLEVYRDNQTSCDAIGYEEPAEDDE